MHVINNELTELIKKEGDFTSTKDLIEIVITKPTKEGFDIKRLRKVHRVMEVLEKSTETIELEDADYEFIKKEVETFQWANYHKDIIKFIDIFEKK